MVAPATGSVTAGGFNFHQTFEQVSCSQSSLLQVEIAPDEGWAAVHRMASVGPQARLYHVLLSQAILDDTCRLAATSST